MSDPTREILGEAFRRHEHLAPDPAQVRANIRRIARSHARRRTAVAVSGTTVAGGLVAGLVVAPGALLGPFAGGVGVQVAGPAAGGLTPGSTDAASPTGAGSPSPDGPAASPTSTPTTTPTATPTGSPSPDSQTVLDERLWQAYFSAGYTYDDAVALAKVWKMNVADIGAVKAEAGRRLLAGQTLPIAPQPSNVASAKEAAEVDAYFAAGYGYDDAVQLAKLWKLKDAYSAKVKGGQRLMAGEQLPIKPQPQASVPQPSVSEPWVTSSLATAKAQRFLAAGYTYDDAVALAKLWNLGDAWSAKIEGGRRLILGETLPIKP